MENTKELLLVHAGMPRVFSEYVDGVNIMLTPQFYTTKREDIPVKYAYQAKRIAPSLFDGLLENQEEYHYFVLKENDSWLFIAYNLEEIKKTIEEKGISVEKVSKIYFTEQIVSQLDKPILLGEKEALVNLDGTMTIVPQVALGDDEKQMRITQEFTPKKGVSFEGSGKSIFPAKEAYALAAIFAIFSGIYLAEGFRYKGNEMLEKTQMQSLLEDYPSLQSSYARKSVVDDYKTIDIKERKKREIIRSLSHMIFKGSRLKALSIDDKKFKAEYSCEDSKISEKLKELAKKEKFNINVSSSDNNFKIEGTL